MTSRSDSAILRVYLPEELVDELHALAHATDLPVRRVVRGLIELGMKPYLHRWTHNALPVYDDEYSDRPYQGQGARRSIMKSTEWEALRRLTAEQLVDDESYDDLGRGPGPA